MMYALMMILALAAPPQAAPEEVTMTRLLGIEIGTTADEAARILLPLGTRDAKEEGGRIHEVWRLEGTGFAWVAFRLDAKRRVVWITGHRRPGHEVPFDRFSGEPAVKTDAIAIWHVKGTHTDQRLTVRGSNGRAQVLTLAGHQ
jgi:hypothetical protein